MSMFTECFITKVSFPATNGTITIAFEPAQKYQVELEGVKYCLFVSKESQQENCPAALRQIGKCQWNCMSLSDMSARALIQAKLSKARVKLFTDKNLKKLERVELI